MPLANLSERFYQKFGHDLVEELVTWLNQMDTTYRTDLRELNELNFARFDAKLEQRAAELDARIEQVSARLDVKIDGVAARLDAKIDSVAARFDAKLEQRISEVRSDLRQEIAGVKVVMSKQRADLIAWMFVFWAGTVLPLAGLMFALFQHFRP